MLLCYFCIYVIILYNYFFRHGIDFFQIQNEKKKKRAVQEKQIIVFLVVAIPPS